MRRKIGVVGATGLVGQTLLKEFVLKSFDVSEVSLFGSKCRHEKFPFLDSPIPINELSAELLSEVEYIFFVGPSEVSERWIPVALEEKCKVIDGSSAFRCEENVPLIIPEINGHILSSEKKLISSPNCSTTLALMALYPLHKQFGLKKFFITTYQAVSGSGRAGLSELEEQSNNVALQDECKITHYPYAIFGNAIPKVGDFCSEGYSSEENKLLLESRKILSLPDLQVSSTCVRIPVFRAHSMAIHADFQEPVDLKKAKSALSSFSGVQYYEEEEFLPNPLAAEFQQTCQVGRLRKDRVFGNGIAMWVVGDQLLKGAALNLWQIFNGIYDKN